MALFGPADQDLPLLTQVCQLNLDDLEEVQKFVTLKEPNSIDKSIAMFIAVGKLSQRVLQDVMNLHCIRLEDFRTLETMLQDSESPHLFSRTIRVTDDDTDHPQYWVPLERITTYTSDSTRLARRLLLVVKEALLQMRVDPEYLLRCVECENIFYRLRAGQKYCSHRCADRAGQKRRRRLNKAVIAEKKEYSCTPSH